jgi:octaprenyl-diphosphate synthase
MLFLFFTVSASKVAIFGETFWGFQRFINFEHLTNLKKIQEPVREQMEIFEDKFKNSMNTSVPLLDKITRYIVKRKGKQVRPLFVFLTAGAVGRFNDSVYRAASLIELLHTATLVHDDVVDDSLERRGFFSINALWKNKIAVLVGDFLLSKGLLLSVENNDFELLRITSDAVRLMSEGELLQIEKARRLDITEEVYFEIIRRKTASLIASCCECGAFAAGADEQVVKQMRQFGEKTGIAFQIKDDLFDYENSSLIGKPAGIDIKEQKMTLPLIHALNMASGAEKRRIIRTVKNNNNDPEKVAEVIAFVKQSGGIAYAEKRMHEIKNEALDILKGLPESMYRTSLEDLVKFTVERNY